MIYQTVNEQDFIRAFDDIDRSENFSREARRALFEWYDDLSEGMGEGIKFDPIGICVEWGEFTVNELVEQFGYLVEWPSDLTPVDDDGIYEWDELLDTLADHGILIRVDHIGEYNDTFLFCEG